MVCKAGGAQAAQRGSSNPAVRFASRFHARGFGLSPPPTWPRILRSLRLNFRLAHGSAHFGLRASSSCCCLLA